METTQTVLTVLIWFLCPILILLILVQGGAGDLSSTFGGGGQLDSTLGVGASRKMGKLTGWLSFGFLLMVLVMAIPKGGAFEQYQQGSSAGEDESVLDDPADEPPPGMSDVEIQNATDVIAPAPADDAAAPADDAAAPADDAAAPAEEVVPADDEAEADKQEAGLEIDVGAQPADDE